MSVLSADGLTYTVNTAGQDLTLVSDVSLEVGAGQSIAIMGRSGSGKTTLLSMIGLLLRPSSGSVRIAGVNACTGSDAARARIRNTHLGFVFQGYSLVSELTARHNVCLPLNYGTSPSRADRRRADELLELVGLGSQRQSLPRHLSGGEQQRVAIARALIRQPKVILADEPTGALDTDTGDSVMDILVSLVHERQCALVLVTHDDAIAAVANEVHRLNRGALVA